MQYVFCEEGVYEGICIWLSKRGSCLFQCLCKSDAAGNRYLCTATDTGKCTTLSELWMHQCAINTDRCCIAAEIAGGRCPLSVNTYCRLWSHWPCLCQKNRYSYWKCNLCEWECGGLYDYADSDGAAQNEADFAECGQSGLFLWCGIGQQSEGKNTRSDWDGSHRTDTHSSYCRLWVPNTCL